VEALAKDEPFEQVAESSSSLSFQGSRKDSD